MRFAGLSESWAGLEGLKAKLGLAVSKIRVSYDDGDTDDSCLLAQTAWQPCTASGRQ